MKCEQFRCAVGMESGDLSPVCSLPVWCCRGARVTKNKLQQKDDPNQGIKCTRNFFNFDLLVNQKQFKKIKHDTYYQVLK